MNAPPTQSGIFRGPKTLSIMPTYTCPAACTSCASMSGPRVRESIPLSTILDAIREAKDLGFYNVVFTGGEATLQWANLLTAIGYAHDLGFPTRLVTNAHWAHSITVADQRLAALIDAGLTEINFSTGDEHARFIPVERVINATVASVRRQFRVWIMVELRATREVTTASLMAHPLIAALSDDEQALISIGESPWMPLDPSVIEEYPKGVAADRLSLKAHLTCNSVLQTYTVQADGKVGACCGIGMRAIPELNVTTVDEPGFLKRAIEEAEDDFLKVWLHYKGPEQVLRWAATKDSSIHWEGLYAHRCQACARVYRDPAVAKVIHEHYEEVMADVLQSAWLDEEYIPGIIASDNKRNSETRETDNPPDA